MSKEQVAAFFQKMQTNEAFKKELASVQNELQQTMMAEIAEKLVALGARTGFAFTADDLRESYKDMVEKMSDNQELSNAELDAVAGGWGFYPIVSIEMLRGGKCRDEVED